jgi:hypothetical protein
MLTHEEDEFYLVESQKKKKQLEEELKDQWVKRV